MDRINKWGLLNSLIEIVNNESSDDPHAILAQYFLKNFDRIGRLMLYKPRIHQKILQIIRI